MKRKSFTGPFWLLLIFGILLSLAVSLYLVMLRVQISGEDTRPVASGITVLRFFVWPGVVFAEAIVYWLLRRRNIFRALSWAHTVIFILSFVLFVVFAFLMAMHYPVFSVVWGGRWRRQPAYLFWGLVMVAHLAFVAVLVNCFRKAEPAPAEGGGQENLLDDVVL